MDPPNTDLDRLYRCMLESSVKPQLYVINNSPRDIHHPIVNGFAVECIKNHKNIGYGSGHNVALQMIGENSDFHFVLNTDIQFGPLEFEKMLSFMREHQEVGLLMPRVVYEDGNLQYLCKLLPTPADVLLRRFAPAFLRKVMRKRMSRYELQFSGYDQVMDIPFLSGCFMLFRVSALRDVGLFDERYFMYAEDVDLSRRMHARYRTVFFPGATIVHSHARSSYKNRKLLWWHTLSLVSYFRKWGWFFDDERTRVNRETLLQFEQRYGRRYLGTLAIWQRDGREWNK